MRERQKKSGQKRLTYWRCTKKSCRKELSIREGSLFSSYKSGDGRHNAKLTLCSIMKLIWLFLHMKCTIRDAAKLTQTSTSTLVEWWGNCKRVCTGVLEMQPKFVGTEENPIQIVETYMSGRRKQNQRRVLDGEKPASPEDEDDDIPDWGDKEIETETDINRDNASWKWVLGIYHSATKVRFVRLKNRSSKTLLAVIKKYVAESGVIWTDQWKAYCVLSDNGFKHQTVKHSENYVDHNTGCHTQGVERSWAECKCCWRASRGNKKLLQSHLDEAAWRRLRSYEHSLGQLFDAFLHDTALVYRT